MSLVVKFSSNLKPKSLSIYFDINLNFTSEPMKQSPIPRNNFEAIIEAYTESTCKINRRYEYEIKRLTSEAINIMETMCN